MSPLERYLFDQTEHGFIKDDAQMAVVLRLSDLYAQLCEPVVTKVPAKKGFFAKFKAASSTVAVTPKGLYLWGGVGQGKTYLMDIFYDALPFENKQRTHFHRFMQKVHQQLRRINNVEDPLELVADQIAADCRVLCLMSF
jgi:Predicted ATPase